MKMADYCQFVGITGFLYLVRVFFFSLAQHPNYCAEYEESNAFYCKFIVGRCVFLSEKLRENVKIECLSHSDQDHLQLVWCIRLCCYGKHKRIV